ncbi:MAG: hemerythrin domain-containing protein [Rhodanobacteraceae bacterium]
MDALLPSRVLAVQHRRIDEGVRGIAESGGQVAALADALDLLRLHLYLEEQVLFPPLVKSGLAMPVFVMKREHGEMWPLMETLVAACAAQASVESIHDTCRRLFQLLQIHNPKEEQIVYTAADRLAAQPAGASLAKALDVTKVPDGWTCEMARQ